MEAWNVSLRKRRGSARSGRDASPENASKCCGRFPRFDLARGLFAQGISRDEAASCRRPPPGSPLNADGGVADSGRGHGRVRGEKEVLRYYIIYACYVRSDDGTSMLWY